MANIKCKSCGKRYSYHESDLCPHCGAYNKPSARMRVDFDEEGNAELLAEDALTPEQREQVQAILGGVEQTRTYLGRIRAEVQTPLKYKTKKNDKTCRIVEN